MVMVAVVLVPVSRAVVMALCIIMPLVGSMLLLFVIVIVVVRMLCLFVHERYMIVFI